MAHLVLVRHGESLANERNEFTGWTDVPLTQKGKQQAHIAGQTIRNAGLKFTVVHTSYLKRAILTAYEIQTVLDQLAIPIMKSWRLNERHYGALRGLNKNQTREIYGKKQVALWRRNYFSIPPLLQQPDRARWYRQIPLASQPLGESLAMAEARLVPYWLDQVAPRLIAGQNQLIVAHGSTLRALIKYLEQISDQAIDGVEVENGQPIHYELTDHLTILQKSILD